MGAGGGGGAGAGGGGGGGGTLPVHEGVPPQPSVAQQQTSGDAAVAAASGLASGEAAAASDAAPAEGASESQSATDESKQDGDKANGSGGNIISSILIDSDEFLDVYESYVRPSSNYLCFAPDLLLPSSWPAPALLLPCS